MSRLTKLFLVFALVVAPLWAHAEELTLPASQGFVSDFARVIDQPTRRQVTNLLQELQDKTGAEIAIVTVETTHPLTPFDYAMKLAETWQPGEKGKDNGIVFLVATKDRSMFIATGYGVEGILPDGKVGAIQDDYIVPYFQQGEYARGILAGTQAIAQVLAQEYGVSLTGTQLLHARPQGRGSAPSNLDLLLFLLIVVALLVSAFTGTYRSRYTRFGRRGYSPGGFGSGFGGGGFGGFGGGGFGGGGAGRSW